ncbi:MAG: PEP-utilizing enzyme, partial [Pseudomonadota bacterium]
PITILGRKDIGQGVKGKWVLFKPIVENFTDPLTPLTADLFGMALNLFPGLQVIKGWCYVNLEVFKAIMPFKAPDQTMAEFIYRLGSQTPPLKISLLKLPLFLLFALFFYLTQGLIYARSRRIPDDFMDGYRDFARQVDLDDSVGPEISMFTLWTWPKLFTPIGHLVTLVNLASVRYMIGLDLLRKLVRRYVPDLPADAESFLCSGSQGVLSAEMGRDIWSLAQEAKRHPPLRELLINNKPEKLLAKVWNVPEAEEFAAQLDRFLIKHGHRGLKEIELRSSRWEENPAPVLGMVRNYMLVESDPNEGERKVEEARKDIESQIREKLERYPLERLLGLRWRLIRYVADRVKYFAKMRENSRYYHIMGLHVVRKKILRLEAQLMRQGRLKCKDDIFFLYRDELSQLSAGKLNWADVEDRVRERRLEHIRLSRMTPPMSIGVEMTEAGPEAAVGAADKNLLKGQPASPGQYTGLAHVILDPSMDVELKPGEVLVAPFTDPAWTPLFLTAGAAVVEIGSYLSHAGTVAREFGMPCVVDVPGCTSSLQTGCRVKVDGFNGLVRIINQEDDSEK